MTFTASDPQFIWGDHLDSHLILLLETDFIAYTNITISIISKIDTRLSFAPSIVIVSLESDSERCYVTSNEIFEPKLDSVHALTPYSLYREIYQVTSI